MTVIDAFPFFNELELLRSRLALLKDDVHLHVVAEGDRTHQGHPKRSLLSVAAYNHRRVNREVAILPEGEGDRANWQRENAQRDHLKTMLDQLGGLRPDDLVLLTDADEIPDPRCFPTLLEMTERSPVMLEMRMIYYGHWEDPGGWFHAKAARVRDLPDQLSALRLRFDLPLVLDAGWHLSYLGGPGLLRTKVRAFAHAENLERAAWERIRTGRETGLGPNGEELIPFDVEELPEVLAGAVLAAERAP